MSLLNLDKKILDMVLKVIDSKFGNIKIGGVTIDKITDLFESQNSKIKDLEREIEAIKSYIKDIK